MPIVPYRSFPTAEPAVEPTGKIGLSVPGAAFGTNIAEATKGFGQTLEHASDQLSHTVLQIQALQNDTWAKDADAQAMLEIGKRTEGFKQLEGQNAVNALDEHQASLKKIREDALANAPNPAAKRMLDNMLTRRIGFSLVDAGGYAGTQAKVSLNRASAARKGAAIDTFDPENPRQSEDTIQAETRFEADVHGDTEDTYKENTRKSINLGYEKSLVKMAPVNYAKARDIFEKVKDTLDPQTHDKILNAINIAEYRHGAGVIADDVSKDLTAESSQGDIAKIAEKGIARAEREFPNNPEARRAVESLVIAKSHRIQAIKTLSTRADEDFIGNWMQTGGPMGGRIVDPSDLGKDPMIAEAFSRLPPNQRDAVQRKILANAKLDSHLPTEARNSNYQLLYGMSTGVSPEELKQFNDTNLSTKDLTLEQAKELQKIQAGTRKSAVTDTHVTGTMHDPNVKSMLMQADVLDKTTGHVLNQEQYNRLSGMVAIAIRQHMDTHQGKPPTEAERHVIASRALQATAEYPDWGVRLGRLGIPELRETKEARPIYKEGLPENVRADLTRLLNKEGVSQPTDEQLMQRALKIRGF